MVYERLPWFMLFETSECYHQLAVANDPRRCYRGIMEHFLERLRHTVWDRDPRQDSRPMRCLVYLLRLGYGIFLKFSDGILTLRAMSLVYTTLLSLVPLLAVSFSVLKAFGVHNQIEPFLMEFLLPLGQEGVDIANNIIGFVENIKVGVLGAVGIAFLFYTVISLVQKIEEALNGIWCVESSRGVGRRFADYLSVILIGPVLIFTAVTVAASVRNSAAVQWLAGIEPFGTLIVLVSKLAPWVMVCGAFAFVYGFVPNTRVKPSAALAGGVFTGVLWFTTGRLFAAFVVDSSSYSAIYSGFAGVVLFMVWLYVGWLIVLVGAQVSFYWQNPDFLDPKDQETHLSHHQRERLGLAIMALVGHAHYFNTSPWTQEGLANRLALAPEPLTDLLHRLERAGLLVASDGTPPAWYPARDIETITLLEMLDIIRRDPDEPDKLKGELEPVQMLVEELDRTVSATLASRSLKEIVVDMDGR